MHQVRDDFGVGLRFKDISRSLSGARCSSWFSIMPLCTTAISSLDTWVKVGLGHTAIAWAQRVWPMPRMPFRSSARCRFSILGHAPTAHAFDAAIDHRDSRRVIPAIFETFQTFREDGNNIAIGDGADDAAHGIHSLRNANGHFAFCEVGMSRRHWRPPRFSVQLDSSGQYRSAAYFFFDRPCPIWFVQLVFAFSVNPPAGTFQTVVPAAMSASFSRSTRGATSCTSGANMHTVADDGAMFVGAIVGCTRWCRRQCWPCCPRLCRRCGTSGWLLEPSPIWLF